MKSLVTGALGFIGSHVVETLMAEGHEVLGIDDLSTGSPKNSINGAEYRDISILDPALINVIRDFMPNNIFHLAALPRIQPSFVQPLLHNQVNVDGTIRLLEIARDLEVSAFVNSSSASVYGNPDSFPITEETRINPLSPYALQKYAAEQYVKILGGNWGIRNVSLRYFNPFGPRSFNPDSEGNAYSPVLGVFSHSILKHRKVFVTGDGKQSRDFIFVGDVAKANAIAAKDIDKLNGEVFNICSGSNQSILSIAEEFGVPIEFISERPGEAKISWGCNSKFTNLTGWQLSVSVREYIAKSLA